MLMPNTTEEVKTTEISTQQRQEKSIENLLSQAVDKGLPIETIERLLAARKELKAEWAKEQYILAMAKFQSECPVIKREDSVKDKSGKERYKFAPIGKIVAQTKEFISKNGLSYKFEEIKDDKYTTAVCIVTHVSGHTETSSFKVEIGSEEYMTNTQKYGARMTFAKRYAFCNAFGILTGDEDNDAKDEDEDKGKELDLEKYKVLLANAENLDQLSKVWVGIPAAAKGQLFTFKDELKKRYENPKV